MDILLSDIKRNLIFRDTEEEVKDLLLTAPNLIFYKSLVDAFNISSVKMGQLYKSQEKFLCQLNEFVANYHYYLLSEEKNEKDSILFHTGTMGSGKTTMISLCLPLIIRHYNNKGIIKGTKPKLNSYCDFNMKGGSHVDDEHDYEHGYDDEDDDGGKHVIRGDDASKIGVIDNINCDAIINKKIIQKKNYDIGDAIPNNKRIVILMSVPSSDVITQFASKCGSLFSTWIMTSDDGELIDINILSKWSGKHKGKYIPPEDYINAKNIYRHYSEVFKDDGDDVAARRTLHTQILKILKKNNGNDIKKEWKSYVQNIQEVKCKEALKQIRNAVIRGLLGKATAEFKKNNKERRIDEAYKRVYNKLLDEERGKSRDVMSPVDYQRMLLKIIEKDKENWANELRNGDAYNDIKTSKNKQDAENWIAYMIKNKYNEYRRDAVINFKLDNDPANHKSFDKDEFDELMKKQKTKKSRYSSDEFGFTASPAWQVWALENWYKEGQKTNWNEVNMKKFERRNPDFLPPTNEKFNQYVWEIKNKDKIDAEVKAEYEKNKDNYLGFSWRPTKEDKSKWIKNIYKEPSGTYTNFPNKPPEIIFCDPKTMKILLSEKEFFSDGTTVFDSLNELNWHFLPVIDEFPATGDCDQRILNLKNNQLIKTNIDIQQIPNIPFKIIMSASLLPKLVKNSEIFSPLQYNLIFADEEFTTSSLTAMIEYEYVEDNVHTNRITPFHSLTKIQDRNIIKLWNQDVYRCFIPEDIIKIVNIYNQIIGEHPPTQIQLDDYYGDKMNLDNYLSLFDYDPTNSYKSRGKLSEDSNGPGTVDIETTKLINGKLLGDKESKKYTVINTVTNGDCFFDSITYGINGEIMKDNGSDYSISDLRSIIVEDNEFALAQAKIRKQRYDAFITRRNLYNEKLTILNRIQPGVTGMGLQTIKGDWDVYSLKEKTFEQEIYEKERNISIMQGLVQTPTSVVPTVQQITPDPLPNYDDAKDEITTLNTILKPLNDEDIRSTEIINNITNWDDNTVIIREFKDLVQQSYFWADHGFIGKLSTRLNIKPVIIEITDYGEQNIRITSVGNDTGPDPKYVLLAYWAPFHYKFIKINDGHEKKIFSFDELPIEIKNQICINNRRDNSIVGLRGWGPKFETYNCPTGIQGGGTSAAIRTDISYKPISFTEDIYEKESNYLYFIKSILYRIYELDDQRFMLFLQHIQNTTSKIYTKKDYFTNIINKPLTLHITTTNYCDVVYDILSNSEYYNATKPTNTTSIVNVDSDSISEPNNYTKLFTLYDDKKNENESVLKQLKSGIKDIQTLYDILINQEDKNVNQMYEALDKQGYKKGNRQIKNPLTSSFINFGGQVDWSDAINKFGVIIDRHDDAYNSILNVKTRFGTVKISSQDYDDLVIKNKKEALIILSGVDLDPSELLYIPSSYKVSNTKFPLHSIAKMFGKNYKNDKGEGVENVYIHDYAYSKGQTQQPFIGPESLVQALARSGRDKARGAKVVASYMPKGYGSLFKLFSIRTSLQEIDRFIRGYHIPDESPTDISTKITIKYSIPDGTPTSTQNTETPVQTYPIQYEFSCDEQIPEEFRKKMKVPKNIQNEILPRVTKELIKYAKTNPLKIELINDDNHGNFLRLEKSLYDNIKTQSPKFYYTINMVLKVMQQDNDWLIKNYNSCIKHPSWNSIVQAVLPSIYQTRNIPIPTI